MPDIFGREAHDYAHLGMLAERGLLERAQAGWQADSGLPRHDFNALSGIRQQMAMYGMARFESNAQAYGYVTNNLQAVQSMIDEVLYTEDRLMEMVPVVSDVPEGAATYAYRVVDRAGLGRFIDYDGTSAPSANIGVRLVPYGLEYAGIIPEWTLEDLRRAMFTGVALDTETIEAGARGARDHMEQTAFLGDSDRGGVGLVNLPITGANAVTYAAGTAGTGISTLSGDAMVTFLQGHVTSLITETQEVMGRTIQGDLCIYLPVAQAALVTETRLLDGYRSVWEYFRMNNSWTSYTGREPMLKWFAELEGAGDSSSDRMILAVMDRRIFEFAVPITPRIITTINKGYSICAPMEYKMSPGINVKRPSTIRYVDHV